MTKTQKTHQILAKDGIRTLSLNEAIELGFSWTEFLSDNEDMDLIVNDETGEVIDHSNGAVLGLLISVWCPVCKRYFATMAEPGCFTFCPICQSPFDVDSMTTDKR